jgi:2-polyprenyl-6-methoxyphenol hydroxylase-like FAD-dependent oxidoreductase
LRVAVVGGSIGGLCAAAALASAGCDVEVHERAPRQMTSRGTGIVVQPDLMALLREENAPSLPTTSCSRRRYLSPEGGEGTESISPQRFTSWEAIHHTLLAAFPTERYHLGAETVGFEQEHGAAAPVAARLGPGAEVTADLLVCADGWRSQARARLVPGLEPEYAGYVAWRGTLDEAQAPDGLAGFFDDRFTFCDGRSGGHILCYLIPGDGAAAERGRRRLNWVWYVHVPEGKALDEVLSDRDGECHAGSVPAGRVPERLVARVQEAAARELHPRFAELVAATPDPFVQVILDLAAPRMLFGRACLLGDAAFVVRPHTAGAAAKVAADARALAAAARNAPADLHAALAG